MILKLNSANSNKLNLGGQPSVQAPVFSDPKQRKNPKNSSPFYSLSTIFQATKQITNPTIKSPKKRKKKGKSKSSDETETNGAGMKENLELMNSRNDQSQIKKA